MKKTSKKYNIYLIYTILFIFIATCIFIPFIIKGKSFIWNVDGIKQHYIFLKDFNQIIRSFLKEPSSGISLFSWDMGLGSDVIGQYSYYILGDPFAYLSLLFPESKLDIAYTSLVLVRMFFIGISFIIYSSYNKNSKENTLLGSIIYTFSAFSMFAGVRHPYFLNAMIIFPMILLGIDKLFKENKITLLSIFIAISAISNFYFFYMHTVMAVIYAVIKYFCEYRKEGIKVFLKKISLGILGFLIGTLIASIILLPSIYAFLNCSRTGEESACSYSFMYYLSLPTVSLLTARGMNWSYIGVSGIALIMVPIFIMNIKKYKTYGIYFIVTTIFLLVPFLGSLMNGFSFPNNRWCFIYTFILAYITTLTFKTDSNYDMKQFKITKVLIILYSILSLIGFAFLNVGKRDIIFFIIQVLIVLLLLFVICFQNKKKKKLLFVQYFLIFVGIIIMSIGLYSIYGRDYASEFITLTEVDDTLNSQMKKTENCNEDINKILNNDHSFYRIANTCHNIPNLSLIYNYPSIECYLSIGSRHIFNLSKELLDNCYTATCCIKGMSERTKITTLLGTKYYINQDASVPYGYSLLDNSGSLKTYINNYSLSLGVCYDKYILRKDYEKLHPLEKEDILLKTAVIEDEKILEENMEKADINKEVGNSYYEVNYKLKNKDNNLNYKYINVTKENQSIVLNIPRVKNSELYVYIDGFEYEDTKEHKLKIKYKDKILTKTIRNKITSAYYEYQPQLLFNLGYYTDTEGDITVTFSEKGKYKMDDIKILAVPMNEYPKVIENLQKNQLYDIEYSNKNIKGKVNVQSNSILQISNGYTIGWKAYVDGNEVKTINVNTAFIGVPISEGEHNVELIYEVPCLKLGIAFSVIGLTSLIIIVIKSKE